MSYRNRTIWGVNCGKRGDTLFLDNNHIGIGWGEIGNLEDLGFEQKKFISAVEENFPDLDHVNVPVIAGHLYRFLHEANKGDLVVYLSEKDLLVHIGEIVGGYEYHPETDCGYPHQREVKWLKESRIQKFSNSTIYAIESPMSFFRMQDYTGEYAKILESD